MSTRESGRENLRYLFKSNFRLNEKSEIFDNIVDYRIYVRYANTGLLSSRPYFSKIEESCVSPDDKTVTWKATREYDENGKLIENKAEFLLINESNRDEGVLEPQLQFLAENCNGDIQQTENIEDKYSWFEKKVVTPNLTDSKKGEQWCKDWVVQNSVIWNTTEFYVASISEYTIENFQPYRY
jgi:hypothetical protein